MDVMSVRHEMLLLDALGSGGLVSALYSLKASSDISQGGDFS